MMAENRDYLDELLEQVAGGHMLPQEALTKFFLHKKAAGDATLTEADNAFITAMDTVEVAHVVAKWCARGAEEVGGVQSIEVDVRRPGFFHPHRRPPQVNAIAMSGVKVLLFAVHRASHADTEYLEDCLHAEASFADERSNPAFLPVFTSALSTALKAHGLPEPTYIR